ncbi:hypothetical protein AB0I72_02160 [Nocardiopsis sp. NPDC049922]|uniref:hypothetical protein n=1 Tax=Nocardiopsis sp. NPDC049922 TaxID=3155157 RepID=UPI0033E63DE8
MPLYLRSNEHQRGRPRRAARPRAYVWSPVRAARVRFYVAHPAGDLAPLALAVRGLLTLRGAA